MFISEYPECDNSEFRCNTGKCIDGNKYNNHVTDCQDGEDEDGLQCNGFMCYDGTCLPSELRCDSTKDCTGDTGEDEINCEPATGKTGRWLFCEVGE
jgi:low density lipoprotein-related protein 2